MFFKYVLSILFLVQSITFAVGQACPAFFNTEGAYLGSQWRQWRNGETIWHNYICKECGTFTSAKPNYEERQVCSGCGAAHTNEAYIHAPTITKDGVTYALASAFGDAKTERLAQSGFK